MQGVGLQGEKRLREASSIFARNGIAEGRRDDVRCLRQE